MRFIERHTGIAVVMLAAVLIAVFSLFVPLRPQVDAQSVTGVWDGSSIKYQRTCNVFKTATATAAGNTALWTPATGKKFRLMRFSMLVPGNAAYATTAGTVTATLQDAAVATGVTTLVTQVPLAAGVVTGVQYNGPPVDIGNGYLSSAAGNVLNINLVLGGVGAFSGGVVVSACGTEE